MKSKITQRLIFSNLFILVFALLFFYHVSIYNLNKQAKAQAQQQILAESSLIFERTGRMDAMLNEHTPQHPPDSLSTNKNSSPTDTYVFPSQNNSVSIHIFCPLNENILSFPAEDSGIFNRLQLDATIKEEISRLPLLSPTELSINKEPYLVLLTPYEEENLIIISLLSLEHINSLTTANITSFFFVLSILVVISFFIITWQSLGITAPLKELTKISESYAKQDYSKPFLVKTNDEIENLSHSIQTMVESIIAHEKAQIALFRNLSHELKTPLTAISGYAQNIQNGYYEDTENPLTIIQEECHRIHQILDDLIFLSKMDSKIEFFSFQSYDIVEILTHSLEKVESIAILKEIDVEYNPTHEIKILCDKEKLIRVFLNVLSNGLRHTNDWLKLEIIETAHLVSVLITDNGNGFEESKLEKLFLTTTGETIDGNGLGLLIVYEIITKHGGTIDVQNCSPIGAQIKLTLPK